MAEKNCFAERVIQCLGSGRSSAWRGVGCLTRTTAGGQNPWRCGAVGRSCAVVLPEEPRNYGAGFERCGLDGVVHSSLEQWGR